jgi:hypothetical protein
MKFGSLNLTNLSSALVEAMRENEEESGEEGAPGPKRMCRPRSV